jgi:[acyl-carrier-protein] S-malonyltransferase
MTLAILCSGQGRQHAGMFTLTGDVSEAAGLFEHAATLLGGRDPREIVRTDTSDDLHHNRVGQILCTLQAMAAATALRDSMPDRLIIAGYSVGEVAAWGVGGMLDMADTLDLVARRADAMDVNTSPGDGLLFVRGLSKDTIDSLCDRHGAAIAIINPGGAFVLGGSHATLKALSDEATKMNAERVVGIPVQVASHTKQLAEASTAFRDNLNHVWVRSALRPGLRLISGIDGTPVTDVTKGLDKLAAQISQTVHWADCLEGCIESGATAFLELGPGPALTEMVAGACPDIPARCLEDFRSIQGAHSWLAGHAQD